MDNAKVIITDLDGCIFESPNSMVKVADLLYHGHQALLPGVREKFNQWFNECSYIIITTARPECHRELTKRQLLSHGLFWSQLVMGLPHLPRVLINDDRKDGKKSAIAIELPKNEGFKNLVI